MKLLLDEMHAPSIADALTENSLDVIAVASLPDLRGLSDTDLLVHASSSGRALITENIVDFAPLANQWATENRIHPGLVFTNPKRFNRSTLAYPGNLMMALRSFLSDPPIAGQSWIWWL